MEKNKLLETRKSRGFTQSQIAEKLCMDISSYHRREKGEVKIHITEWEKLSKILDVPLSEIYESEESQYFVCKDNASGNYQGTNTIHTIPASLLETQEKYIKTLEAEIVELKALLQNK